MASGRIGQAVLYDLRTRVYDHFQRLSPAFHERYTSGRVISRLTSDVDALAELLDGGVDDLVLAGLSVVSVGAILLVPRPADGAGHAAVRSRCCWWLSRWFRRQLGGRLPAHPRDRRSGDRALRRVARAASAPSRRSAASPATRRSSRRSTLDYRLANERAFKLVAIFAPGIKLIGNVTIAVVLVYGGYRVMDGAGRGRRAGRVPALPAAVLRADAGAVDVLQLPPVGHGGPREALRACSRRPRPCADRSTRSPSRARARSASTSST